MISIAFGVVTATFVIGRIWTKARAYEKPTFTVCAIVVIGLVTLPFLRMEGLLPGYSEGVREGYVTKLSKKGVLWKTWEGQLQVGTGELAAIQEPYHFSVVGGEMADQVRSMLGKKVTIHYREWLVMPWSRGSSGNEVVKIEAK